MLKPMSTTGRELAWGAGTDVSDHRAQGVVEVAGVATNLGHQQPALQRGQQRRGKRVWIGFGRQLAPVAHSYQAVVDGGFPPVKSLNNPRSRLRVVIGQLTAKGAQRASAAALISLLKRDHGIAPGL